MSSQSRKPNEVERRIHYAILNAKDSTLHQREVDALEPDASKRVAALNFLLATNLLKLKQGPKKGDTYYRAVGKKELEVKKDLAAEEVLVLNHIQAAANEGVWTKHLKAKTELHQTVIDRCIKSLVQKQLIKSVKNVKFPTRKIYMLAHLEPSSAITGGPWYTDNELDTEFIKMLMNLCLKFISERSFPKSETEQNLLYPISAAPQYPTAQQIQAFLSKSRITETQLSVEHIEMLLNVLIIDGDIERLPAFGAAMWDAGDQEDDESEEQVSRKRKKKEKSSKRDKKKRKKSRSSDEDEDSDSDSDGGKRKRKRNGSRARSTTDDEESDQDTFRGHALAGEMAIDAADFGGAYVYRAIRQERVVLGWAQAPCGHCPQFDFCKTGGPVNPQQCTYYGDWLNHSEMTLEEV